MLVVVTWGVVRVEVAWAQSRDSTARDRAVRDSTVRDSTVRDTTFRCDGHIVQSVEVQTHRPTFRGALGWWRKVARRVGLHHETTSRGLVRRFVSLYPGKECTEFRRSESERILRLQPYLADAKVVTVPVGDSIKVFVTTVDEAPPVGSARFQGIRPAAGSLGTMNLAGAGIHLEGTWEDGGANRDGFGGLVSHSQMFGRPYEFDFIGERAPIGHVYSAALSHAFLTDLQKVAWHSGFSSSKDVALLWRDDRVQFAQPIERTVWDVGGVFRVGPPHRLGLIGGMVLGERLVPSNEFFVVDSTNGRLTPTSETIATRQFSVFDGTSLAGVLGIRALRFTRMAGLDALVAEQDAATGVQIGTILGTRAFTDPLFHDGFGSLDVYGGGRTRRTFFAARVETESRLDAEGQGWSHLISSGRAAWYFKPRPRWTSEMSLEGAGGWRTIFPFQFALGDRDGGLRGYARSHAGGARRLIMRFEQRFDIVRYQKTRAAAGSAFFMDAGRVWGGDVPFGVDTPIGASVGFALLAAVPANSQRTVRVEVAVPLVQMSGAQTELRFVIRQTRGFWTDPLPVHGARLLAIPEQILSWP